MKTYLFNTENGLYEGETFENTDTIKYVDGMTPVPPPDFEHGQVPVFDHRNNKWAIITVSVAKQLLQTNEANTENKS